MAKAKPLSPKQAAKHFSDSLRTNGVTAKTPDISRAWGAFKEFCSAPVERTTEGFIFHAEFRVSFPDGERLVDYSEYTVAFSRNWYEKGEESDTAHVAECSFTIPGVDGLRRHEWVDVEVDASDPDTTARLAKLQKFVSKVEAMTDLWDILRAVAPTGIEWYAGPQ